MKKYKVTKEFGNIYGNGIHLRREHLTDEAVAELREKHPDTFARHFEEVKANPKPGKPSKSQDNVPETAD